MELKDYYAIMGVKPTDDPRQSRPPIVDWPATFLMSAKNRMLFPLQRVAEAREVQVK